MYYKNLHITSLLRDSILILLFCFSYFFLGCEEINEIENETTFEEKVVVIASLKANTKFEGVVFARTQPFNEDYDIKKTELKTVNAYLRQNEHKIIPLHYNQDGIYNSIYDVVPMPGDVYELFALYNNKSIYSKTIIPYEPEIQSAVLTGDNFIEALVYTHQDEVYGALWFIPGLDNEIKSPDFFRIYETTENTPGKTLYLRTDEIPEQYRGSLSNLYIRVTAFDKQYSDYFHTRNNNQPIDDIFSQVGAPVKWNVYGDDVIGMFIGMAVSTVDAK